MLNVVLVRHGVTEATGTRLGGRTSAALSDDGAAQAQSVAGRLAGLDVAAVYASPIVRTMQTAAPIAAAHGLDVDELEGVQEVEYGAWTDRPLEDVRDEELWPVIQQRPSRVTFPDGESIRRAQARAVDAVEAVVVRHDPGDPVEDASGDDPPDDKADEKVDDAQDAGRDRPPAVVVVSHADVIKAVVSHYLGQPLDLFQRLVVGAASITVLVLSPTGTPRLVAFNDTAHLRDGG